MRYILFSVLFIAIVFAGAKTSFTDSNKQTQQNIEELKKTAGELEARLRLQPDNSALYLQLGFTYAKLGDADKAQNAFENAVRVEPKNATAYYMLGLIYEKKGLKDKAVSAWESCLKYAVEKRMTETAQKHLNLLLKS